VRPGRDDRGSASAVLGLSTPEAEKPPPLREVLCVPEDG
jgi:hypothetical protein